MKQQKLKLSALIGNLRADVRSAQQRVKHSLEVKSSLEADLQTAYSIVGKEQTGHLRAHIDSWSISTKLVTSLDLNVVSFKEDTTLLAVLERALELATTDRTDDYVNSWSAERNYHFTLPCGGSFKVCATLETDTETCRKVKT